MTKLELKPLKPRKESENHGQPEKGDKTMVGILEMFRFADVLDKVYILMAVMCSVVSGLGLPSGTLIFAEIIDVFNNAIRLDRFLDSISGFLHHSNLTRKDVLGDPTLLRDQCLVLEKFCSMNITCCGIDLDEPLSEDLKEYVIYFILLGAVVFVASIGQVTFWTVSSERQANRIRREFLTNVLRQDIGWFDTHQAGQLNTLLAADVTLIQTGLGEKVGSVIQYTSSFTTGFVLGFSRGWKLALVLVALSPAMVLSGILFSYVATKMEAKEQTVYAKAGAIAEEAISSIRTVFAFGGEVKAKTRYDKNLGDAQRYGVKKGMANGGAVGFYGLVSFCTNAMGMWYGGKLIRDGQLAVEDVMVAFFAVSLGTFSMGVAAPGLQAIVEARTAAYTVFQLIDTKSQIDSSSDKGLKPSSVTGNIRFRNVHFSYPSRKETKVLKGVDIEVRPGQTVALVGHSGCGKSTLVQLLMRFYDPQQGQVLVDGVDVKDLNLKWLRQHIGLVSQEPVLFATTIANNIRMGKDHVSKEEINQAAKNANAFDFISTLPNQFHTLVGERGAQLSGGQKQRIAIARALARDPKILLLDEATSALDTESEAVVQDALDKAGQGRTTIVIAHRLSTIRSADVIVCLDQGRVREIGTHHQLMANRGIYYTLVMNQVNQKEQTKTDKKGDLVVKKETQSKEDGVDRKRMLSFAGDEAEETEIDEELPQAGFLDLLRANRPEWPYLVLGSIAACVHGSSQPAFAYIFSKMLAVFSEADDEMKDDLEKYCLYVLAIGVYTFVGALTQGWMLTMAGEALTRRLRSNTFKAMLRQEIAWYDKPCNSTGALTSRLAKDTSLVQGAVGRRIGLIIQCVVAIGAAVTLAFIYGWQLTLVAVSFLPVLLLGGVVTMKLIGGSTGVTKGAVEQTGKVAVEAIVNVRTVAALTKENEFVSLYMSHFDSLTTGLHKRAVILGTLYAFCNSIVQFSTAAIFAFGGYLVEEDEMDAEDVLKVFSFVVFCGIFLGQSASFGPDIGKAQASARRIFYMLERRGEINAELSLGKRPEQSTFQSTVEFRQTRFRYPLRPDVPVLKGLSFTVAPGQTVALVGSSGCGKSTCMALLERFYDVDAGSVKVGHHRLEELNIRWLRSQIGLVSQEPILFDCSIAENIAYGDNSRHVGMDEIHRAAREANIHNFVSALPLGYETNVGDKGTQLSGGQKQRIAIARALVRDPKILLLDEATSALDTESEKVVQEALDRAREGRTCITIAHRLSTVQEADKIVVVRQGEVVEQGTHQQLMALKGDYYRLQHAQNKG